MKHIEQCVRQLKAYRGFLPAFLEDELFEKAEKELQELKAIQVQARVSPTESTQEQLKKFISEQKSLDPDILRLLSEFDEMTGKKESTKKRF